MAYNASLFGFRFSGFDNFKITFWNQMMQFNVLKFAEMPVCFFYFSDLTYINYSIRQGKLQLI